MKTLIFSIVLNSFRSFKKNQKEACIKKRLYKNKLALLLIQVISKGCKYECETFWYPKELGAGKIAGSWNYELRHGKLIFNHCVVYNQGVSQCNFVFALS